MTDKLSRDQWNALTADEQFQYMQLCEDGYSEFYDLLALIPPCPVHGDQCIPHARAWVREQAQEQSATVESLWGKLGEFVEERMAEFFKVSSDFHEPDPPVRERIK